uniref:Uncharacterized protein n=1 Tax=Anguilla anguilla TaxID=7936 RepID=A0A0E9SR86_ANGAN
MSLCFDMFVHRSSIAPSLPSAAERSSARRAGC